MRKYGGRRKYQYNEDDFGFQFRFISCFKTAWILKNIETKRSCQFKTSFKLLVTP